MKRIKIYQIVAGLLLLLLTIVRSNTTSAQTKFFTLENNKVKPSVVYKKPLRATKKIDNQSLFIEYKIPGFEVSELSHEKYSYDVLRIEGFGLSNEIGSPALPLRTEKIALPHGVIPTVTIVESEYSEYKGLNIYPAQEYPGDGITRKSTDFKINQKVYNSNNYYPVEIVSIDEIQNFKDVPIAFVRFMPVQYNPVKKTVRIYHSVKFRISFNHGTSFSKKTTKGINDVPIINNIVLNAPEFKYEKAAVAIDASGYVIVTTPEFIESANTLAQWKKQLGYEVYILSQANWTVAQVKSAIQNLYYNTTPRPSYLTILGDHVDVPDFYYENRYLNPVLKVYSTNYYACMDGPNDYFPEMAHGRIPVENAPQAMTVIQKIIQYEKNPPTDPTFYTKGIHAGYFQDSLRNGVSDRRYARTTIEMHEYMQNQGFSSDIILHTEPDVIPQSFSAYYSGVTQIPPQYLKQNGYPWNGSSNDIINSLNAGRLYMFHRDHGHVGGWFSPAIDISDLDELASTNEMPVVFSINCGSGFFMNSTPYICFAEKLLYHPNGGAAGIVAATAVTRSGFNDAFTIGIMDAIWSDPGLVPDLGVLGESGPITPHEPIYSMGDVMIQGLIRMMETYDPSGWADEDHFHLYHYFGDPAMKIWTALPTRINATHDEVIQIGTSTITISSSNCPNGIATVCFDDKLVAVCQLDNGSGIIGLPEPADESINNITLTISGHNYVPYEANITVTDDPLADPSIRILPFGNSLTFDAYIIENRPTTERPGYRGYLYNMLNECSIDFNFVGSESSGNAIFPDPQNGGFPGMKPGQLLRLLQTGYNELENIQETPGPYLDTYLPDVILLHIGTNRSSASADTLLLILDEIDAYKARNDINTKTILAKIVNESPVNDQTTVYNNNIENLFNSRLDTSLYLVDMETGAGIIYNAYPAGDMHDRYHLTPRGYDKMAQVWIDAILEALNLTPDIPQILNARDFEIEIGEEIYLDLHAVGTETPTLSLTNMTPSMSFDSNLGILKWTSDEGGLFSLTAHAINSHGDAFENISINVLDERNAGYESIFENSIALPYRQAVPIVMPEDGYVRSITMYHDGGSGNVRYGLYNSLGGQPGTKIGETDVTSVSNTSGWQSVNLQIPAFVSAGETVWAAWVYENDVNIYYTYGTPGRARSTQSWPNGMPENYGMASINSYIYSIYLTYSSNSSAPATNPPNAPDALNALFDEAGPNIELTWNDNSNNEENFEIERSVNSESYVLIATVAADQTMYIDTDIAFDQSYTYRVSAVNSAGSSAYSNIAEVTTEYDPAPPSESIVGYQEIFSSSIYNGNRRAQR
ncbi:MAG: hypothetical protein JXB49_30395, partial [Bacteroidales bacterium]|nr:hypothetical protein [Bacteroidales bacterium]